MLGRLTALTGVAALVFACGSASEDPAGSGAAGSGAAGSGAAGAGAGGSGGAHSGGSAGAGGGAGAQFPTQPVNVTPPVVDLPDRPEWSSGPPAKAPGWRESTDPFCSPWVGDSMTPSIWSTPTAVYVQLSVTCNGLANPVCSTEPGAYQSLLVNDGQGWTAVSNTIESPSVTAVGTVSDASLVTIGACAAAKSGLNGDFECLGDRGVYESLDAFVRGDAVYHLSTDNLAGSTLATYANHAWATRFTFQASQRPKVLVDLGTDFILAGQAGLVLRGNTESSTLAQVDGAPTTGNFIGGAPFSDGDYALSDDTARIALRVGGAWKVVGPEPFEKVIWTMRSSPSGSIYALSGQQLYRIRSTGAVELLLQLSGKAYFNALAVNSDTEIFLGINDNALAEFKCGSTLLAWYDGSDFRLF